MSDYKPIVKELKRQGWEVTMTSRGHYRAASPDKNVPVEHFSASGDPRAYLNTLKRLSNAGFVWPTAHTLARDEDEEQEAEVEEFKLPEALPEVAPERPKTVQVEAELEQTWARLKHAKKSLALTKSMLELAQADVDEAVRERDLAREELDKATRALADAKTAFDALFEVEET